MEDSFTPYLRAEEARVGPALAALDKLDRISEAAGDRELTRSQADDYADAANALYREVRGIWPASPYVAILASGGHAGELVSAEDRSAIRAALSRRLDQLQRSVAAGSINDPATRAIVSSGATARSETRTMTDSLRGMVDSGTTSATFAWPSAGESAPSKASRTSTTSSPSPTTWPSTSAPRRRG